MIEDGSQKISSPAQAIMYPPDAATSSTNTSTGIFFSSASCLIPRKIWRDCTGEPPAELITSASAFAFLIANARSSVLAMPASDMPGRSGVTAPITPDSRTTGTMAVPGRKRAGRSPLNPSSHPGHRPRSLFCSLMHFPQILINFYPTSVIELNGTRFALRSAESLQRRAEHEMKIYLLVMLIGTLLTAIHFTSARERQSKRLSQ